MQSDYSLPPFPPFPSATRYVSLGSVEEAIHRVQSSIDAHEGISLIIGPPGIGKSLACSVLVKQFSDTHDVVLLGELPIPDAAAFHRHVLHHLGVSFESTPDGDLYLALVDRICGDDMTKQGLLIIVDEAQSLPVEVLEAIRTTTNIMHNGQPRVCAVVCGGVKLEETLTTPSLEAFTQRVATRCYLHPLNAHETRYYISETIRQCGSNPDDTITDEAIGAIHHACSGVPRLINQMMTEAIECAVETDETIICEQIVDRAWAQLQQLPSPVVDPRITAPNSAPVEFGALEDFGTLDKSLEQSAPAFESEETTDTLEATTDTSTLEFAVEKSDPIIVHSVLNDSEPQDFDDAESDGTPGFADTPVEDQRTQPVPTAVKFSTLSAAEPSLHQVAGQTTGEAETEAEAEAAAEPDMIEFESESATIVWTDDPVTESPTDVASIAEMPASTPLPSSLFGDYEQEEKIAVGFGVETATITNSSDHEKSLVDPTVELEGQLHQEVINLNEMATQARFGGIDPNNTFANTAGDSSPASEHPPIWIVEEDLIPANTDVVFDDSDLLIIEDEVDVVPAPRQHRSGDRPRTVKVDFQAMLARMREGS